MDSLVNKKYYFASDFHFGIPDRKSSRKREDLFVDWLEMVRKDAAEIFLMGDLFDFWFEYNTVVPKGYIRLLGKLAELTDEGIPIHLFRGNHDVWAFNYLADEAGLILHREPEQREIMGSTFFLAHGDGLGPGDSGYKFLKRVFENCICQWLFRWFHPDLGTRLGLYFSRKSRLANMAMEGKKEAAIVPGDEMLVIFAKQKHLQLPDVKYFVFGHRHTPLIHPLDMHATIVILGDWLVNYSYAVFDGNNLEMKFFTKQE